MPEVTKDTFVYNYEVAFTKRDVRMQIVEMVPKGQTVKSWSEMITTQIFFGNTNNSPEQVYQKMHSSWSKSCKDTKGNMIQSGKENSYSFSFYNMQTQIVRQQEMETETILLSQSLYNKQRT